MSGGKKLNSSNPTFLVSNKMSNAHIEMNATPDAKERFLRREQQNHNRLLTFESGDGLEMSWALNMKPTVYHRKEMENEFKQLNQKHKTLTRLKQKLRQRQLANG